MAIPLLVLYELSIWIVHFTAKKESALEPMEQSQASSATDK